MKPKDPAAENLVKAVRKMRDLAGGARRNFSPKINPVGCELLDEAINGLSAALSVYKEAAKAVPAKEAEDEDARIYPCDNCGTMRTKAEGGTCFTLCEECWEKEFGSAKSKKN